MTSEAKNETRIICIVAAVLIAMFALLAATSEGEAAATDEEYCDMVQLGMDTDGEYGWPDFQHRFKRDCQ